MKKWNNWINTNKQPLEGGQGRIYFVKDRTNTFKGIYALKELKNPKRKERFEREIDAIRKLSEHNNVINIVDRSLFYKKKRIMPYYVMEKADYSLIEYLQNIKNDFNKICKVYEQTCNSLAFIHKNGIIHRDLKPGNILLINETVKISDFGLCLFIDAERLTHSKEAVGSRYYMAPELEDGRNLDVDYNADIYSLSKILYYMFSGGKIFSREIFKDKEYDLKRIYEDDRYSKFNILFDRTIVSDPRYRAKNIEEVNTTYEEIKISFLNHPRSTLEKKVDISTLKITVSLLKQNRLTKEEINEVLSLIIDRNHSYKPDILGYLAKNADKVYFDNLISLLKRDLKKIDLVNIQNVAEALFMDNAITSNLINSLFHVGITKYLAKIALDSKSKKILNNIAMHSFLFLRNDSDLLERIKQSYDLLATESKTNFMLECIFCDFDNKYSFFRNLLKREKYNSLKEYEMIIGGLTSCIKKENINFLIKIGDTTLDKDQKEAFAKGVVLGFSQNKDKSVINNLDKNSFADPVVGMLIEVMQNSENAK